MEVTVIAQEFQRFFSLFFSGKQFSCFLLADNGEKFILRNTITPVQPEQKTGLLRIEFDKNDAAIIAQTHQLHLKSDGDCFAFRIRVKNLSLFIVATGEHKNAGSYLKSLVPEVLNQLEQRFAAAQLVSRFQSKINELENEKAAIHKAQLQHLLSKVGHWKSKLHQPVSIDSEIFNQPANLNQPEELIEQLSRAYELQCFLQPGADAIHITIDMLPEKRKTIHEPARLSGWNRASLLLDKYEEAAESVMESGLTVNGKTIAQFLVPSVSPPAITDALKKNRKGIHSLLRENPLKWPLLRKNLKQVRELHENSTFFMTD